MSNGNAFIVLNLVASPNSELKSGILPQQSSQLRLSRLLTKRSIQTSIFLYLREISARNSMSVAAMMNANLLIYPFTWLFRFFLFVVLSCISYLTVTIIYYLRYHPYARYPGPLWARISPLYALLHAYRGDLHFDVTHCHERYGISLRKSFLPPDDSVDDVLRSCCSIYS